jgi:hypothetical protein
VKVDGEKRQHSSHPAGSVAMCMSIYQPGKLSLSAHKLSLSAHRLRWATIDSLTVAASRQRCYVLVHLSARQAQPVGLHVEMGNN